jgi:aquaporin Z
METPSNGRILAAELFGTMVLMLGGPGLAILLPNVASNIVTGEDAAAAAGAGITRLLIISLGFGLSLLIMAYVIGPISGCHINPAVTLGMWLAKKVNGAHAVFAVVGQLIGAVIGATLIYGIASGQSDDWERGQFAANLWSGDYWGLGSTIVVEVLFTAILVVVVLFTTTRKFAPGMGGLVAGLTLTLIHLVTIPVDNTSVNPARSLGAAIFSDSDALQQLWAFIVFPLIGAVVGVIVWLVLDDTRLEDTLLAEVPGAVEARDAIDDIAG